MKRHLLLTICFAICLSVAKTLRGTRDVTELDAAQKYLPTKIENETEISPKPIELKAKYEDDQFVENENNLTDQPKEAHSDCEKNSDNSTLLGPQGYVYRTVLRLRYRRDVSHLSLNREYLPPVVQKPAIQYLPTFESSTKPPMLGNEYLPPVAVSVEPETEAPSTEESTTTTSTTLPITTTTEASTQLPTTFASIVEEPLDDTAILAEDGYHYKKPDVVPDLSPVNAYLPPLEETVIVVEAENPDNDVTSALIDDGYHYRAMKRFRF